MNTFDLDKKFIAPTYARFPVEIVSGKGSVVVDNNGRKYIDLSTGIAVNTFGLCDDEWIAAVTGQLTAFQHTSNLYYSSPCARLAEALCQKTGMKKVFFSNSGAEANECAIKIARKYAADKYGADRYTILTLKNSFHGRTITTLSATGQDVFHQKFLPMTDGFVFGEANNFDSIVELAKSHELCGIMLEVVQGEGGVIALDREFVQKVYEFCLTNDIILIVDEVQTGNGRTGELYGFMNYGITPDVFTTAKGLGGGLPIGATVIGEKAENVLGAGDNGSTFGGNPIVCSGALSIINRLTPALMSDVKAKSKLIFDTLSGAKGVKSVTGLGLMVGVEIEKDAGEVIAACRQKGVLIIKAKNKLRLLPALNIPTELLKKSLDVIVECVK